MLSRARTWRGAGIVRRTWRRLFGCFRGSFGRVRSVTTSGFCRCFKRARWKDRRTVGQSGSAVDVVPRASEESWMTSMQHDVLVVRRHDHLTPTRPLSDDKEGLLHTFHNFVPVTCAKRCGMGRSTTFSHNCLGSLEAGDSREKTMFSS